jgi:15-cis-phytoene synthase
MLSRPGEIVRRHDPDRFLTALFAPPNKRYALLILFAFNHELARARELVSEPTLALIRLQWWREVVEGARRRHEVAEPLHDTITAGLLARDDLLALIEAREIEAEPSIDTTDAWHDYLLGTAGGLAVAAGRLLGAPEPERLGPLGAAYGAGRLLRGARWLARHGRCLLPRDRLEAHGLIPEAVIADPELPALRPVLDDLAGDGRAMLRQGRTAPFSRQSIAAALPAVLAARDLRRPDEPPRPRGVGDRLAVTAAALLGRI